MSTNKIHILKQAGWQRQHFAPNIRGAAPIEVWFPPGIEPGRRAGFVTFEEAWATLAAPEQVVCVVCGARCASRKLMGWREGPTWSTGPEWHLKDGYACPGSWEKTEDPEVPRGQAT